MAFPHGYHDSSGASSRVTPYSTTHPTFFTTTTTLLIDSSCCCTHDDVLLLDSLARKQRLNLVYTKNSLFLVSLILLYFFAWTGIILCVCVYLPKMHCPGVHPFSLSLALAQHLTVSMSSKLHSRGFLGQRKTEWGWKGGGILHMDHYFVEEK